MKGPLLKRQCVASATASLQAPFKLDQIGRARVKFPCLHSPWPKHVSDGNLSTEARALSGQIPPVSVLSQAWSMCLCCEAWDAGVRCVRVKVALRMLILLFCWDLFFGGGGGNLTLCIHQ